MPSQRAQKSAYSGKLLFVKILVCFFLSILVVRLWYLQGIQGAYYRDRSENNRIRYLRLQPPRGTIFDRKGRILVRNRPSFNVALITEDISEIKQTISEIARITGREEAALIRQFEESRSALPFEPKVVIYDISRDELAKIKVKGGKLPGVLVTEAPSRAYPNRTLAAQLFGYTREISKFQLEKLKDEGYQLGDLVGQSGLEIKYEKDLRGKAGSVQLEVDARGRRRGLLGVTEALPGNDLELTLDLDLQKAAEEGLGGYRGAVVALDPKNGEVLVLASAPGFDANLFSGQVSGSEWRQLTTDSNKPFNNRAISSAYPPGSTSKILWAVAGLAEKKINSQQELYCSGAVPIGNRSYHCHKKTGHGAVNLEKAIMVSCNAYFYQLGQRLGIDGMSKYLKLFGFGLPTGVDLPGEASGIAPSQEWKRSTLHQQWFPGDTVPVSIGQGYFVATPMQMAQFMASVVNNGLVYKPRLVRKIINAQSGEVREIQPELVRDVFSGMTELDRNHVLQKVRDFAVEVVNNERGTGRKAKLEGILVGGKTGTAQVTVLGGEHRGDKFKDHAWFIAFAPADDPSIAMAVIVENSGHGGQFAAPVAKLVLETYFRKRGMLPLFDDSAAPTVKVEEHALRPGDGLAVATEGQVEHGEDGLRVDQEESEWSD